MSFIRFVTLIIALTFVSCKKELTERLNFKKAALHYDLVIEGGVNTFTKEQFIRLSRPSLHVAGNDSAINDAEVFINNIKLTLTATPGIYTGTLQENKNYGDVYHLKVVCKGIIYKAEDTLKKVSPITLTDLDFYGHKDDGEIRLSVPKHTFSSIEPGKLFYHFSGKSDWDASKLDSPQTYSYAHTFAPPHGLYPILEQRSNRIAKPADSIKVYKFSVSNSYEKYLYCVFVETDWKSIFSTTPGQIKGNISGNALGYFYCTDVILKKIAASDLSK